MKVIYSKRMRELCEYPTFKLSTKETAKADRAIPIGEMWAKFMRGENIVDPRMIKQPTFNPIERNPFRQKGIDLADIPRLKEENAAFLAQAQQRLQEDKQAYEESQKASQVTPNEPQKTE